MDTILGSLSLIVQGWSSGELKRIVIIPSKEEEMLDMANQKIQLVAQNKALLIKNGIEHSIFIPTATGFNKAILDATQTVRTHFVIENFHDYSVQQQGPKFKVIKVAVLLEPQAHTETRMSLYRPVTKKGDPRMWFRGLQKIAQPNDQVAIVFFESVPYLLNLSALNIQESIQKKDQIGVFLEQLILSTQAVSNELLGLLEKIARNPIPAPMKGDTAIGMAIEGALGIAPNSSKEPDYKGIELKSSRSKPRASQATRVNLFAQVADWTQSHLKSSSAILDAYGYESVDDGCFKLYCTVSALRANSQGLFFDVDEEADAVQEKYTNGQTYADVAVWLGAKLRERLLEKHAETFWIEADSIFIDGREHFLLKTVRHTRRPLLTQFLPLMQQGVITMDHLIKRKNGKVGEKGPLFKISPQDLNKLFPEERNYLLV